MEFLLLLKAIMSRLLFFGHGIAAVYMYNKEKTSDNYWFLITPLVFLFIESCVTCIHRSGREYKYVWPSGFFYITCIIPIIWFIELDIYDLQQQQVMAQKAKRTKGLNFEQLTDKDKAKINREILVYAIDSTAASQLLKKICELGLMICIVIARWLMPRGSLTKDQLSALLLVYVGNSADILELFDTFEEPEVMESEKVLIAVMCVFTWSIYQFTLVTTATVAERDNTKGFADVASKSVPMNRRMSIASDGSRGSRRISTVSQDPFGKVSNGSDTFGRKMSTGRKISVSNLDGLGRSRKVSMKPSAITRTDLRNNTVLQNDYVNDIRAQTRKISVAGYDKRGRGRKTSHTLPNLTENVAINAEAGDDKEETVTKRKLHGELYQILVTLLMQDGPFLILRLYLIIRLNVTSEMHIFFTCKNAIVSLLLVYRLLILSCHGTDEEDVYDREEAATKLHNIQMAMKLDDMGPLSKISVK